MCRRSGRDGLTAGGVAAVGTIGLLDTPGAGDDTNVAVLAPPIGARRSLIVVTVVPFVVPAPATCRLPPVVRIFFARRLTRNLRCSLPTPLSRAVLRLSAQRSERQA